MKENVFGKISIAPCGMNCAVCIAFLRPKNKCEGCRSCSDKKPAHCFNCRIAKCGLLAETKSGFCCDCPKFPCTRMKQLDVRYRKNYRTSLIQNLKDIRIDGIESFLESEQRKWTCPSCGKFLSIHRNVCLNCNQIIEIEENYI